ncbi:hydrolase 1, exosortase A system-associated [Sphingomonas sp. LB-2]|uniref:hydrolase 1, exosortase A system-associated n=1 Tax=Sphingomonas caeni TaxID=2984949 RepID=UPI00222EAAD7|nr:hydrolase 1, exosortase A system-associated [Sphingomonas caeni]MCW3848402.1 hydrolase 1, exosortase A system-associated [Sphingomonas caeni]
MRRLIEFPCAGETLVGTLDEAAGGTGLLIVSGGNEIRAGAHRGMALLGARVAAELGTPVFRFDRRGIGDSSGVNGGFESSVQDIAAAAATFTAEAPHVRRLIAFGNCDAATALALFHSVAGIDSLLLANPWVVEAEGDLPPTAAIRARYAERLRDPKQWVRLVRGGVDIKKLISGLSKISHSQSEENSNLVARMADALAASGTPVTILLAKGDNTAIAFRAAWKGSARIEECDTASHSFAHEADKAWLFERVKEALA